MDRFWGDIVLSKVYCEPFGSLFRRGKRVIERGYNGKVYCNNGYRPAADFWKILHSQRNRLLKEVEAIKNGYLGQDDIEKQTKYLNNKLNDRRELQRAAAYYLSIYGINTSKQDEEILQQHIADTKRVNFTDLPFEDCIQSVDSVDTFIYMTPSVQVNVQADKFVSLVSNISGKWVLDTFFNPELEKIYKDFNVRYSYSDNLFGENTLSVVVSNI